MINSINNRKRYVVEGTWSGYNSSQSRVCHRDVISAKRAAKLEKVIGIRFGDGTNLYINIRLAKPREKVDKILGYSKIIDNCWMKNKEGMVSVDEL